MSVDAIRRKVSVSVDSRRRRKQIIADSRETKEKKKQRNSVVVCCKVRYVSAKSIFFRDWSGLLTIACKQ